MNENLSKESMELIFEAADALWALAEGKPTDRDPKAINQDLYDLMRRLPSYGE